MQRPLLLNGFMASGKSSVGKRVSELAGRPFIDLDSRIEARFNAPVTRIFAEQGEAAVAAVDMVVVVADTAVAAAMATAATVDRAAIKPNGRLNLRQ